MIKNKKLYLIIIFIFIFSFIIYIRIVKSNIDFTIKQDSGDIKWNSYAIKAKTNIRWQPKGYYLSLDSSEKGDFGYPLRRKTPMIKLYINSSTVKAENSDTFNGVYTVNNTLSGKI